MSTLGSPSAIKLSSVLLSVISLTEVTLTVTTQVAVTSSEVNSVPFVAVTVIVAVPDQTGVTLPFLSTLATFSLLLVHTIVLYVALFGVMVGVS